MARLSPEILHSSVRNDWRRKAEVRVYDKLAEVLDDEFTVFYSSPWLKTDSFGNEKDGECDFLIAHPAYGFLAIEVKGGNEITYDPKKRKWYSTDHNNIRHTIKNPIEQAKRAKYEILEKLRNLRKFPARRVHIAHGVIFPSVRDPDIDLGADRPKELFCNAKKFNHSLREWVSERLKIGKSPRNSEPLGSDGIAGLVRLLDYPIRLKQTIGASIDEDEYDFKILEPTQYHILDYAVDVPRLCIQGGAGTGKTVVAMEEAKRNADVGKRTLLTCYNRPLAAYFKQRFRNVEHLDVGSFHSICRLVALKAGIPLQEHSSEAEFNDSVLPTALNDAMERQPSNKWDTVVVDEGQDFKHHWWIAILASLKEGGKLRIFWDSNQIVYDTSSMNIEYLDTAPMRLNRNLRNTKSIHAATSFHYTGIPIKADGPVGRSVVWKIADTTDKKVKVAMKVLRRLVKLEVVSPGDIAVLVNSSSTREKLLEQITGIGLPTTNADNLVLEETVIDTVRRFKGLERRAVIVIIDGDQLQQRELAYVAFSRARSYLCVIHSKRDLHWIKSKTEE